MTQPVTGARPPDTRPAGTYPTDTHPAGARPADARQADAHPGGMVPGGMVPGEDATGITLALNAAESRVQAAAMRDGEFLFAQEWHVPSQGTELLAPALSDALSRMRVAVTDIRRIACVRGPGSFTGLRLALSTAAGMARALGALQGGMDYTQLLACGPLLPQGAVLWVLTHARRGLVHMQGFRMPGENCGADAPSGFCGLPAPIGPVQAATLEAAVARMASLPVASPCEHGHAPYLVGSGATRNRATLGPALERLLPGARFLPARFDHPAPSLLLPLAAAATYGPEDVQPMYVRPCDAEENLPALAAARGMDPDEARRELARLTSATVSSA